ncbi:MAG TPA: acyl-CoA dehydrogenase family protein [Acidimicrobiales bacterium]|nr:acyl-CoA dehydrogenase family protein [Acidimicrobiales bacterium]
MDFALTEDQVALQEAARQLLDDEASPARVRRHLTTDEPYDVGLWRAMVDQGWLGVAVPEDRGGLGLGWVEAAVLLDELGRHAAPVPFLPHLLAAAALDVAGEAGDDGAGRWAASLVAGERLGCVAWDPRPDWLTATADGGGWRLCGRTGPVEGASAADVVVVPGRRGLFAVDLSAVGRPPAESAMDLTRSLSWLDLDDVAAVHIGGPQAAADLLDRGAVGTSAMMLGGADRVLEMTTQYAKDRVQFDQPIGSFQAVKHRCADMLVDVEGMRSVTWYGAWAIDAATDDARLEASMAKIWCSDAAKRVMGSGLQVHGGIGFTWDHDLHLFIKRAQSDALAFGSASYHRERLADLLDGGAAGPTSRRPEGG